MTKAGKRNAVKTCPFPFSYTAAVKVFTVAFLFCPGVWHFCFSGVVGSRESFVASIGKGYPFRILPFAAVAPKLQNCLLGSIPNPLDNAKGACHMDGRKRTVQVKFRVTEAERELIGTKMRQIPTNNLAAYARKMLIDGYIIQIDHTDIKAMTAELQKIGVNINQIARRVNSTGNVYEQDIAEIKGALAEIWRLQRLSLLKAH
jgi:hypothetical protein